MSRHLRYIGILKLIYYNTPLLLLLYVYYISLTDPSKHCIPGRTYHNESVHHTMQNDEPYFRSSVSNQGSYIFHPNEALQLFSSFPFSFLRMSLPNFPLFKNAIHYATHDNGVAIYDDRMNQSFSYLQLIHAVALLRSELLAGKR